MIALKPNDVIDVIAPASRCEKSALDRMRTFLATWQLQARIPDDLFGDDIFSAHTTEMRFKHLHDALMNPTSKAIWCLRGGYGSMKLIPLLTRMKAPLESKIVIGGSDITALHIFLQNAWGWPSIHGPSLQSASSNKVSPDSLENLKKMIFRTQAISLNNIIPLNAISEKKETISAPIIGGNLSLIQASLGTPWQINANGKILFIEEVNERGYRIDRMLEQLQQANIMEGVAAVLFGDVLGGNESDGRSLGRVAIRHFAERSIVPVLQLEGVGHGFVNHPLWLGQEVLLGLGEGLRFEV